MIYLIAGIQRQNDYSDAYYGVLEVTQELVDRLEKYREIAQGIPHVTYLSFEEKDFDLTGFDLNEAFPELKLEENDLESGNTLVSTLDLSNDVLFENLDLPRIDCREVHIFPNGLCPSFCASGKHSGEEYWFEVSYEEIKDALKAQVEPK